MELGQILYNISDYLMILNNYITTNKVETVIILLILWMLLRIYNKRKRKLKKKKYKKVKLAKSNKFYNTGFRFEICLNDIIKFKLRFADYCDKKGIRYSYLIDIKLFGIEFLRVKYIDQKGHVYKRNITFRS